MLGVRCPIPVSLSQQSAPAGVDAPSVGWPWLELPADAPERSRRGDWVAVAQQSAMGMSSCQHQQGQAMAGAVPCPCKDMVQTEQRVAVGGSARGCQDGCQEGEVMGSQQLNPHRAGLAPPCAAPAWVTASWVLGLSHGAARLVPTSTPSLGFPSSQLTPSTGQSLPTPAGRHRALAQRAEQSRTHTLLSASSTGPHEPHRQPCALSPTLLNPDQPHTHLLTVPCPFPAETQSLGAASASPAQPELG